MLNIVYHTHLKMLKHLCSSFKFPVLIDFRLIATCKKVEVNFLARQAVSEVGLASGSSSIVGEVVDCEEMNGDFPGQVL